MDEKSLGGLLIILICVVAMVYEKRQRYRKTVAELKEKAARFQYRMRLLTELPIGENTLTHLGLSPMESNAQLFVESSNKATISGKGMGGTRWCYLTNPNDGYHVFYFACQKLHFKIPLHHLGNELVDIVEQSEESVANRLITQIGNNLANAIYALENSKACARLTQSIDQW